VEGRNEERRRRDGRLLSFSVYYLLSTRAVAINGRSRPAPTIIYFSGVARLPQAMTVPVLFGAARM